MRAKKTETVVRQEQILQAALDLAGKEGVCNLSIAGIAERVGIVPSALYRHFKSKDEVLDGILELLKKRLFDNVSYVRKQTHEPLKRLEILLIRHVRLLSENPSILYVVFSDGIFSGRPERKAGVAEIMKGYLGRIQQIIEEGIHEGSIRKDVDPKTAAIMFLGMILPAAVLSNVSGGDFDMVAHAKKAWPAFLRYIAG
jgi:AcrR family transcriptional regulator